MYKIILTIHFLSIVLCQGLEFDLFNKSIKPNYIYNTIKNNNSFKSGLNSFEPDESSLKPKLEVEIKSMNIKIGGILISSGAGILALSTMKDSDSVEGYQDFEDIYLSRNRWRVLGFSLISLGGIFISTGL